MSLARWGVWGSVALAVGLAVACGSNGNTEGSASGSAAQGTTPPANTDPRKGLEPLTTQGNAVALMPDESTLVVADEDHEALFLASPDLAPDKTRVVAMPGPPAQVVALDWLVFVTVRTLPSDASRAIREKARGALPTPTDARALAPTKVDLARSDTPPPPEASPSASASVSPSASSAPSAAPSSSPSGARPRASASASASASAGPKAPPPPPKRGTPPIPFDASVARQSQGGLLVVMRPDAQAGLVEVGRIVLAPDAWGLALTPDRKRAVVTSAWSAEVSIVDIADPAAMKLVAHEKVAREPRGVAIAPDGKTAFVSHLVGSALTRIDDVGGTPKLSSRAFPSALARTPAKTELTTSLGYALAFDADGRTLFAPRHALGAEGVGSWWGTPTVDALDVASGKPLQPAHEAGSPSAHITSPSIVEGPEWTAMPGVAPTGSASLVQPRATVFRKKSKTLFVASEGSDRVVELGTRVPDPAMDVRATFELGAGYDKFGAYAASGGAPTGLVLSRDENALLVFCRSTFDVARIDLVSGAVAWLHLADDGLPIDAAYGRRLFYTSTSSVISGGLGCAACHPDGRDDGYVWRQGKIAFFDPASERFVATRSLLKMHGGPTMMQTVDEPPKLYPRQTPMLAGRVRADGPYGWHGENKDLLERLIEGFHLHRGGWEMTDAGKDVGQHVAKIDYLADFIRSGLLPPPTLVRDLDDVENKGKTLFESEKTKCTTCHVSDGTLTNRSIVPLAPLAVRAGFDSEENRGFKTPSLTFIGGTAPYFHDGSAATLDDLVRTNGQRMGDTSQLGPDDQKALVAYLKTL